MNAPRNGWSQATLATVRMHAEERSTRTASLVLAALSQERGRGRIPTPFEKFYDDACDAVRHLGRVAVALVESRDAAVFGDVVESAPAPANDGVQDVCTRDLPKALAVRGHDFPTGEAWGVLIGVARCQFCNVVARSEHFAPNASNDPADPIPPTQPSRETKT